MKAKRNRTKTFFYFFVIKNLLCSAVLEIRRYNIILLPIQMNNSRHIMNRFDQHIFCRAHYFGMSFFKGYIMMYNRHIILYYSVDFTVNSQVFHFWSSKVFVKWQPTGGHLKTNIGIRYPTLGTLSSVCNNIIIIRGIGIHYLIYVFSRTFTI